MAENTHLLALRSYYSVAAGGLVTLEDDVLSIVRQIKELYGDRVSVQIDPITNWFHLVEHCEDATDRLIFSVEELDARVLERLRRADSQWRGHEDPYLAAERQQDANHELIDNEFREQLLAEGERVHHALRKDGRIA